MRFHIWAQKLFSYLNRIWKGISRGFFGAMVLTKEPTKFFKGLLNTIPLKRVLVKNLII
jgi:hypothetical protein